MPFTRNDLTSKAKPEELYLSVNMVVSQRTGVSLIIEAELPDIYLVRFRLVGNMTKTGKFRVHLVYPLDGYPHLGPKEQGHLMQSLNKAAAAHIETPVMFMGRSMLQQDEVSRLPRRMLRLAQGHD